MRQYANLVLSSLCGLVTLFALNFTSAHAKNVALLVGVDNYQSISKLGGTVNDVASMKAVLINKWQFKPKHITTLTNAQATQKNIIKALHNLKHQSSAGDEVFIYFSGHGTSVYDTSVGFHFKNALATDSGAFVPVDFNVSVLKNMSTKAQAVNVLKNHLVTGQYHFRPILTALNKDRHVTAVMDACFSGAGFRNVSQYQLKNKSLNFPFEAPRAMQISQSDKGYNYPYKRVISIGAASKGQQALEISNELLSHYPRLTRDKKPHGAFTDVLLRILHGDIPAGGADGIITYAELENAVQKIMAQHPIVNDQTPQFQPYMDEPQTKQLSAKLMNRPLFGIKKIMVRSQPDGKKLKIKLVSGEAAFYKLITPQFVQSVISGLADFIVEKNGNQWVLKSGNQQPILQTSNAKHLRRRIMAAYWLKNITTEVKQTTTLRFNALPAEKGNHFDAGDQVQFGVNANKPSALLLFNITNKGGVVVLYQAMPSDNIRHRANQLVKVPPESKLTIQPPFGLDKVVLVALNQKLTDKERAALSPLFVDNLLPLNSASNRALTRLIRTKATALSTLTLQTYDR